VSSLTYAIGDVHGCHDQLTHLLAKIRHHSGGRPYRLVFLGDYIDRGPDSAAVIETVRRLHDRASDQVICLKGNHEAMLLEVLAEPQKVPWWIQNGGDAALASFQVKDPSEIPTDVVRWIAGLPTVHEDARRFYVHAGFRPGAPVHDSDEQTRLWIREPFLSADYDFGKHVVHGHTPLRTALPDERRHRTNLDTAAVFGGVLTAGVFSQDQDRALEYLQV
jgi:serine/threonine protein phosphatase 1